MANENTQNIILGLESTAYDALDQGDVNSGLKAAGNEAIKIVRERTGRGIDVNGKRFKKYTRPYRLFKRRFIKGGGGRKTRKRYGELTEFKAKNLPNHIRLTGKTFSDIAVRTAFLATAKNKFTIYFGLYMKERSKDMPDWLRAMGRDFFGISTKAATRKKELERIYLAFIVGAGIPAFLKKTTIR